MSSKVTASDMADDDLASLLLIAQLELKDVKALQQAQKGKGRAGSSPNDAVLALEVHLLSLEEFSSAVSDVVLARSFSRALQTDQDIIGILSSVDQAENDDRAAALALSRGEPLPPATQSQRSLAALSSLSFAAGSLPTDDTHDESCDDESEDEDIPAYQGAMSSGSTSRPRSNRDDCIICTQTRRVAYRAPCRHPYCRDCLKDLVETSTRDESLFPVRCCHQPFPIEALQPLLHPELRTRFKAKSLEFGAPAAQRVYCVNPQCSTFLGPYGDSRADIVCHECKTIVCSDCKNIAHPKEDCTVNATLLDLQALAQTQHWQTCPGCGSIVELSQGCYHMTCRCRKQFCYLCAAVWKTCTCEQWDEQRLLDDAERRVLNEHGERQAVVQPQRHAERVRHAMDQLREDHACDEHDWRFRHGEGQCEECSDYLPVFLMRCRNCQMLVCRRCTQNRL
ncbi:hypothetical protein OF83DRAFT_1133184 [Amylostereum chailletii]|nr:hypothetical protein OF83DRAFT_1133184 [Amylostereum chailletii]